jgi:hypothetical protein
MPRSHYLNLETINEDGSVPASRLNDPISVHAIVQQLIRANRKRSRTDSQVAGLMDGNPPYLASELKINGTSWRCNTNWRIGEAFKNVALTSYWDVVSEAKEYAQVRTAHGNPEQREKWSGIITEEFDKLNRRNCQTVDQSLNYMLRLSHHDMVLYRCGPVMYDDTLNFRARAIQCNQLLVPDGTPACVNEWTLAVVRVAETADRLYSFIRNPKLAEKIGYDVKAVRKSLLDAVPNAIWNTWPRQHRYDWEWYEQRLRNNDLYEASISHMIPLAHVYWREFPKEGQAEGRISHAIVVEDDHSEAFLFRSVGRFANWHQVIHPFYYDTGDGSHHSVKGLGIKAYGALETYNRMQCHAVDSAIWDSASHWQANDSVSLNNSAVVPMGPFLIHPPGLTLLPFAPSGKLDGLVAIKEDVKNTLTANLSQYRQDVRQRRAANSEQPTARQISYEATNEQTITRSGITWYLEQLDDFYGERYRRAANPNLVDENPGGREALAFQKACLDRKVPREAIAKIESVKATRTVGYGSADSRLQTFLRMIQMLPMYNEQGRQRIIRDLTVAEVGRTNADRYITPEDETPEMSSQHSQAQDKVAVMKLGIMPLVTPDQNPVVFAGTYLQAAAQAAGSLQQGADLMEVFGFISVAGPAIRAQLDRIANDPSRKTVYEALNEQWEALAKLHEKLEQQVQKQSAQNGERRMKQQQQMNEQTMDFMLRQRELQGKLAISERKAAGNAQLRRETAMSNQRIKEETHRQDLALKDADTASNIVRQSAETTAKIQNQRKSKKSD